MKYTRMFFSAIFDTLAIVVSMWLFFLIVMVGIFILYYKTGFLMNPWLPIGLFFIYVLFRKDGVIETLIEENKIGEFD
ncbi:hypothetical protein DOK76_09170 [Vagococcus sp. DIV0080]|uniref:RDD domain-containing protein n=1 Tax=Candidatus Vagococcus giribetii TaxID=2230876 RepID=A0ABS3HVR4_9ENTE|nr:hypothetical protein [Vagococcus sp. DIV0080]MBO0477243.1 hypothetical protein [Vagococcus sp. DIV0080]